VGGEEPNGRFFVGPPTPTLPHKGRGRNFGVPMNFGEIPTADATGAVLAHSIRAEGIAFKKGRVLNADDVAALTAAGIGSIIGAQLSPDDIPEDVAATRIAKAVCGDNLTISAPFTGRVNLFAGARGIAVIDRRLEDLNALHESITVATVREWEPVEPKQMVATIKIIPFSAPKARIEACEAIAKEAGTLIRVAPLKPKTAALIQTTLPGTKDSVLDKSKAVMADRMEALGGSLLHETRVPHETAAVEAAIRDMIAKDIDLLMLAGASAITDRRDVLPAALERAGGTVDHYGMPVDPGNLLMLGHLDGKPVVGLPGCARSPKFNGVDWVLQRLCAGIEMDAAHIMRMGIGGLLTEVPRPQPRNGAQADTDTHRDRDAIPRAPDIACIILAAGQSRRMGKVNKLLAEIDGKPMVRWAAEAALASSASPVYVVLGHEAGAVRAALEDLDVTFIDNPDYAQGIAGSVKRGIAALPAAIDGALVCLGDMPRVTSGLLDRLIAAYNPVEGRALCIPTWRGKRGNPVLIGKRFFAEMQAITGDVGARPLISQYPELTCEVEMEDDAVLVDIDTPQALEGLGG
jgi:molybdenum cofactor cytidylyltransferase